MAGSTLAAGSAGTGPVEAAAAVTAPGAAAPVFGPPAGVEPVDPAPVDAELPSAGPLGWLAGEVAVTGRSSAAERTTRLVMFSTVRFRRSAESEPSSR